MPSVSVAATALQEAEPGGQAHDKESDRVERMGEVLVGVGRARRVRKVAFEGRPARLHEKPAQNELDVGEEELEAGQLIGQPKVSEADMMEGSGEHLPQHIHEPAARRAVGARHRLYEIDEEEGDESECCLLYTSRRG